MQHGACAPAPSAAWVCRTTGVRSPGLFSGVWGGARELQVSTRLHVRPLEVRGSTGSRSGAGDQAGREQERFSGHHHIPLWERNLSDLDCPSPYEGTVVKVRDKTQF